MRVIAPLFATLASIVTIGAAAVRLWWSKPKAIRDTQVSRDGHTSNVVTGVQDPKAPSWLRTAAKWWLIIVVFGSTILFVIFVIFTVISLST